MASEKKIAVFAATGCRGCDQTVLDAYYQVSSLQKWADFSFWPYLLGSSLEDLRDGARFDICLFSGCIRTEDDRQAALRLRERSEVVVALGACAGFGGIPGLVNLHRSDDQCREKSANDACGPSVPELRNKVTALDGVSSVDYYVPGCPPNPDFLRACFQSLIHAAASKTSVSFAVSHLPEALSAALLSGTEPPKGSVFAGERTVCAGCSRRKQDKSIDSLAQISGFQPDAERCLLEQGLVCLGIVTREGCGGLCTAFGIGCRGCYGKAESIEDPGIKAVAAIGSMFPPGTGDRFVGEIDKLNDPAGTLYRYTLSSQCLLMRKK